MSTARKESLDVIVIGRNESETLEKCLKSANVAISELEKELGIKSDLVYVDSQSTDGSTEIAKMKVPAYFFPLLDLIHPRMVGIPGYFSQMVSM